jgi:signal peptidase I
VENYHPEFIPDPFPAPEKGPSLRRFLLDTLETLLLSLVLFLGINAISARIRVDSISMQPTLVEGDYVLINKIAYKVGHPSRGDVIVFRYPPAPDQIPYIKRVVGLQGEHVHIAQGKVYINGVALVEPYLKVSTNQGGDWDIPEGHLFVMGDNRNNSSDSRNGWTVPFENIIGKAEVIYWPPKDWNALNFPSAVAAEP